jgi:hypothetical protein
LAPIVKVEEVLEIRISARIDEEIKPRWILLALEMNYREQCSMELGS